MCCLGQSAAHTHTHTHTHIAHPHHLPPPCLLRFVSVLPMLRLISSRQQPLMARPSVLSVRPSVRPSGVRTQPSSMRKAS